MNKIINFNKYHVPTPSKNVKAEIINLEFEREARKIELYGLFNSAEEQLWDMLHAKMHEILPLMNALNLQLFTLHENKTYDFLQKPKDE